MGTLRQTLARWDFKLACSSKALANCFASQLGFQLKLFVEPGQHPKSQNIVKTARLSCSAKAELEACSWFKPKRQSLSCTACPARNEMLMFLSKYEAKQVAREVGGKQIPCLYNHASDPRS